MPLPRSAPAITSLSQWTWRYVRLHAMPRTPRVASVHHHLRGTGDGEEQDEGDRCSPGVGGMAGGEGRASGVNEPVGRTGTIDQCLEKD